MTINQKLVYQKTRRKHEAAPVDLNRMLPAWAAYMGQNGLGATNRYLFMTPERFRDDLDKLSPSGGHGEWYTDQQLMSILADL